MIVLGDLYAVKGDSAIQQNIPLELQYYQEAKVLGDENGAKRCVDLESRVDRYEDYIWTRQLFNQDGYCTIV